MVITYFPPQVSVTYAQKLFSNESGTPVKKPIPHDFKQPTNFPTSTMIQSLASMRTDPIDKFSIPPTPPPPTG
jgi:hypothetical protein